MYALPHIVFVSGREPTYTRNDVLLHALNSLGTRYRLTQVTDSRRTSLSRRVALVTPRFIQALRQPHDLVMVGFYGHPLACLARRLTKRPILFDAFVSTYGTVVEDRGRAGAGSLLAKLMRILDRAAAHAANRVLMDTAAQADYFARLTGLPRERVGHLPVGCNEMLFHPQVCPDPSPADRFCILFYGTYQPLQGAPTIARAAQLLTNEPDIHFRLIGKGQELATTRALAAGLPNVTFDSPIPYETLPAAIAAADVCLAGPFGATAKAGRVVTGKTYQFLAMAKPTIVADTPPNRELLRSDVEACFVPSADPEALAAAILTLRDDLDKRKNLASAGRKRFLAVASQPVITRSLVGEIDGLL